MRGTLTKLGSLVERLHPLVAAAGSLTVVMATLAAQSPVAAQEPITSFEQLSSRVAVGEKVWVTDTDGQVTHGRLDRLTSSDLTLNANGGRRFEAERISLIRHRQRDSVRNGALVGLGVGGGMATAWCIGALLDDSGDVDPKVECPEGVIFAGLGTLLGAAIDAIIPGKFSVVYRGATRPGPAQTRLSLEVVPVISPHRLMLMGVVRP